MIRRLTALPILLVAGTVASLSAATDVPPPPADRAVKAEWQAYARARYADAVRLAQELELARAVNSQLEPALTRLEAVSARLEGIGGEPQPEPAPDLQRFVSAHEMAVLPPQGGGTPRALMEHYLGQLRAAGIDAIALFDAEANNNATGARQTYLDAAQAVGLGVFLEPGFASMQVSLEVAQHPAYFTWRGRKLVSSYFGQRDQISLARELEHTLGEPFATQLDVGDGRIAEALAAFPDVDGWGVFKIVAAITTQAQLNRELVERCHAAGKTARVAIVASYRGLGHKGNWMQFEAWGYTRLVACWRAAIDAGADAAQYITANDVAESSHIGSWSDEPILVHHWVDSDVPAILDHSGFREFGARYAQWFKTGVEPVITADELYYAYRLHPRQCYNFADLPAADRTALLAQWGIAPDVAARIYTNAGTYTGDLSDAIHVAVRLTAPAEVWINGAKIADLSAGEHLVAKPGEHLVSDASALGYPIHTFGPSDFGFPRFEVRRDGRTIIAHTGELEITPYILPGCRAIFARKAGR